MADRDPNVKLRDDPSVPTLAGWVNITEAAEILGITRQHSYKLARTPVSEGGYKTLHRVGTQPSYVVSVKELEERIAAKSEKARLKFQKEAASVT